MTRLTAMVLVASLGGCAWFQAHVEPVIKPIETCAGQQVTAANFNEALADLKTQNYADLAIEGATIGWSTLVCVIDDITAQNSGLKPAADKFKTAHAAEIASAQK